MAQIQLVPEQDYLLLTPENTYCYINADNLSLDVKNSAAGNRLVVKPALDPRVTWPDLCIAIHPMLPDDSLTLKPFEAARFSNENGYVIFSVLHPLYARVLSKAHGLSAYRFGVYG